MKKREKKKHRKRLREIEQMGAEIMARYGYLSVRELEFDAKMRRACLRMAKKRAKKLRYIQ